MNIIIYIHIWYFVALFFTVQTGTGKVKRILDERIIPRHLMSHETGWINQPRTNRSKPDFLNL